MDGIEVRLCVEEDYATLGELIEKDMEFNQDFLPEDTENDHRIVAWAAARNIINHNREQNTINRGWIALYDGQPAGLISTTTEGFYGTLYVDEKFRGKGIGATLIEIREKYLKDELGLTQADARVLAGNKPSRKLLSGMGYEFTEASKQLLKDPDLSSDTVLNLTKQL